VGADTVRSNYNVFDRRLGRSQIAPGPV
jgi:hypothetical protein